MAAIFTYLILFAVQYGPTWRCAVCFSNVCTSYFGNFTFPNLCKSPPAGISNYHSKHMSKCKQEKHPKVVAWMKIDPWMPSEMPWLNHTKQPQIPKSETKLRSENPKPLKSLNHPLPHRRALPKTLQVHQLIRVSLVETLDDVFKGPSLAPRGAYFPKNEYALPLHVGLY